MRDMTETAVTTSARGYPLAAAAVFALLTVLTLVTFRDYGVTWDEDVQREYGGRLLAFYTSGFADRTAFSYANLFYYGGLFDILAGLLEAVSPFGPYETRHLLGGAFTLFGLWGCWKLTDLLAGPRAALLAVLLLAATPLLYGHGFGNPKDTPFAWLSIWASYFACRMLLEAPRIALGTAIGAGLALGAALGQRVLAGHLPAWLLLTVLGSWALSPATHRDATIAIFKAAVLSVPLAILTMAIFWPWSVMAPGNVFKALAEFANFPWQAVILWNGQMVPSDNLPALYLPVLMLFQLPIVLLLALPIGLVGLVRARPPAPLGTAWAYVAMTAFAPILITMIARPTVYNGMRHFLFVIPPLAVLAAGGIELILRGLAGRRRARATRTLAIAGALGLAIPIAAMARLHPYEYIYYNLLVGGVPGAVGRFELDYWGASLTEAARVLDDYVATHPEARNNNRERKVFVCGKGTSASYALAPHLKVMWVLEQADFYLGIEDPYCTDRFKPNGPRIAQIVRGGVALSSVYDLRASRLPDTAE